MKVAGLFLATLGVASAFVAPIAPKFQRSRGMVKATVDDLIGKYMNIYT